MRNMTVLVLVAALAVGLSACGRKGKPIPPEGSTYPRTYPNVEFPPQPQQQPQQQPPRRSGAETQAQ